MLRGPCRGHLDLGATAETLCYVAYIWDGGSPHDAEVLALVS